MLSLGALAPFFSLFIFRALTGNYRPPTKLQEGNVFSGVCLFRVWGPAQCPGFFSIQGSAPPGAHPNLFTMKLGLSESEQLAFNSNVSRIVVFADIEVHLGYCSVRNGAGRNDSRRGGLTQGRPLDHGMLF